MNRLSLINVYQDDDMLRRVFSWLSRIGASPKFGSRPIAWYQIHQCHAIDRLLELGIVNPVMQYGRIQDATNKDSGWTTPDMLFTYADNKSRETPHKHYE